jgi:hypothetical protein
MKTKATCPNRTKIPRDRIPCPVTDGMSDAAIMSAFFTASS